MKTIIIYKRKKIGNLFFYYYYYFEVNLQKSKLILFVFIVCTHLRVFYAKK